MEREEMLARAKRRAHKLVDECSALGKARYAQLCSEFDQDNAVEVLAESILWEAAEQ